MMQMTQKIEGAEEKTWYAVANAAKILPDNPIGFSVGDRKLAAFNIDGSYYILDNICPHAYALMTDGFVEDDVVECPLHGATFHIPTGKCLSPPADADLRTYPVKVIDGQLYVEI